MTTATTKSEPVLTNAMLAYYAQPGLMTDPRELGDTFDNLPTGLGELCQVVQQNLLHVFWAERYGRKLTEAEQATVGVRSIYQKLVHLRAGGRSPAH